MTLTVSIIQMDIAFGDPKKNLLMAEKQISHACKSKKIDIIVLPELWTTGYDLTRLDEISDKEAENTIAFLKRMAVAHNIHIVGGSVANKKQNGIFNTLIIINNKGELVHTYDKLHLFQLMDEHIYLQGGAAEGLFSLEEHLFAGVICYDIRFPEWIRTHTTKGAEAIFVVAEWPLPRLAHWRSLLIARAIENQCYVIACNRAGSDPNNAFAGHSIIIDPWGEIIVEAEEGACTIDGTIDLKKVKEVRKMIPIFADRKPEFYS